jgi:hypothetical protein
MGISATGASDSRVLEGDAALIFFTYKSTSELISKKLLEQPAAMKTGIFLALSTLISCVSATLYVG